MSPPQSPRAPATAPPDVPKPKAPEPVLSGAAAGILMLIVGGLALLFGRPWLFPSLGPTAYLQAANPEHPSSRFYNAVVGHAIGIVMGFLAVLLLDATVEPSVITGKILGPQRMWATVLAVALTVLVCLLLKASHPPAAATTMLITLGAFEPKRDDIAILAAGILITAVAGELIRIARLRLRT